MIKLLSALRIGQLELSHRMIAPVDPASRLSIDGYRQLATPGGLIIAATGATIADDQWKRIAAQIHVAGGLVVAAISPPTAEPLDLDAVMSEYQRAARHASSAGFDGVELDAGTGSIAERWLQSGTGEYRLVVEAAQVLAGEVSPDRVGVRLSPCRGGSDLDVFAGVMRALSEHEVAYVHLAHERHESAAPVACKSVTIDACAVRQAFRTDLSCALIASDFVDLDIAASAVERRWADAIGFFQIDADPSFISDAVGGHR